MNRFWFAGKYYYRAFYFKGSANSFSPQKVFFDNRRLTKTGP